MVFHLHKPHPSPPAIFFFLRGSSKLEKLRPSQHLDLSWIRSPRGWGSATPQPSSSLDPLKAAAMSFFSPTVVGTPMRFSGYSSSCVSHGCLGSPGRNPLPPPHPGSVCPLTSILLQEEPQELSSSPPSQDKGDWTGGYHCFLPRTLRCDCFLCSAAQLQPPSHDMPISHPQRLLQSL